MSVPGKTGSAASSFVTDRSALAATVVVSVAERSLVSGSGVVDVRVTVLLSTVPPATTGSTVTVRVKTALPTPRLGIEQLTVPPEPVGGVEHDQPTGNESVSNVVPAGSVSVHCTVAAASGPAFVTVIVYERVVPAVTGSAPSTLAIERSAVVNPETSKKPTMGSWSERCRGV